MTEGEHADSSDEDIAGLVQGGDIKAFGVLVHRYEAKMLRYGNKFLARYEDRQDSVQDVFLKAYENIQSFDTDRSFSSWIYRIAHNTFVNVIRKHDKEKISFFEPDSLFAQSLPDEKTYDDQIQSEIREILDGHLIEVDVKYREVLVLYYYEEKDYEEIAEILKIPKSTVGVRLARGRKKLREQFSKHD